MEHHGFPYFTNAILIFTFWISPFIALGIKNAVGPQNVLPIVKKLLVYALLYDLLFYAGYSIRGDYPDYIIFSLEWFCFTVLLFSTAGTKVIWVKVLRVVGFMLLIQSVIIGLVGIIIFPILAGDMESSHDYHVTHKGKVYEIRRFESDGRDAIYRTYIFCAYITLGPFEHSICSFRLSDDGNQWYFDGGFQFNIVDSSKNTYLVVTDSAGHRFTRQLQ